MSYEVRPGSAAGRFGAGFGQGLSEQIPKEMERYRLAKGLQNFSNQYPDSPLIRQYADLLSIPGVKESPQLLQTFGELAKMSQQASAAQGEFETGTKKLLEDYDREKREQPSEKGAPSLSTREAIGETLRPMLPPTRNEIIDRGVELFKNNPAFYKNDINNAFAGAEDEFSRKMQRSQKLQEAGKAQKVEQEELKNEFRKTAERYGDNIVPERIYNRVQNKAIEAMLPKDEGGEGLTQQEASQKYIPELDDIARDFQAVDDIGDWMFIWNSPKNAADAISTLQKKFKKSDMQEDFADTLIGKNGLSPQMAYSEAYPIHEDREVYPVLKGFKKLDPLTSKADPVQETKKISERIAKKITKESSPLSIAMYLKRKGYDPQEFINYLIENQDQIGLTTAQVRQLQKPDALIPRINDLYLMIERRPD